MDERITILNIDIDNCSAKQAMKKTIDYMESEVLNIVEMVTADILMHAQEESKLKESLNKCDMVLVGEKEILEAAVVDESKRLQEIQAGMYLKLMLHYLHKNHLRLYL